jgi:hypothetical protein
MGFNTEKAGLFTACTNARTAARLSWPCRRDGEMEVRYGIRAGSTVPSQRGSGKGMAAGSEPFGMKSCAKWGGVVRNPTASTCIRETKAFENFVPSAGLRLPDANHFTFISNEDDVGEMNVFPSRSPYRTTAI